MKAIDIARTHNIDETLVSRIRHGKRFTDDISLAIEIAKLSGKKPITYIKPRIRKLALAAHPELNKVSA